MPRILVVEDEAAIARVLVDNLVFEGHEAEAVADGAAGLERALAWQPDLVLLDVVLPTLDGYEVCRRLRAQGAATPIIMLTARGEEVDKVLGLELGADDYVTKPVGVRELMARIKAVMRRGELPSATGAVLEFAQARIDFDRHEATVDGRMVHLSPKAFGVLRLLWESGGRILTRPQILQQVWGYEVYPTTRTVDNHIAELRSRLEPDPARPRHLLTVHGVGYRFVQ